MDTPDTTPVILSVSLSKHSLSDALESWVDALKAAHPGISWVVERSDDQLPPTLKISSALIYQAKPEGIEHRLFLQAVGIEPLGDCPFDEALRQRIKSLQIPHAFVLFISNQCPHCPKVVTQLLHYSRLTPLMTLKIVDAQLFQDDAADNKIQSVPTLILNEQMRWNGQIDVAEVVTFVENQDPSLLGTQTLSAMIEEGRADRLATMMLEANEIFPAFEDLLINEKWSFRLGAMVVMETLIEKDADLVADYLMTFFDDWHALDKNIKGDLIYLMGETQKPVFRQPILDLIDNTEPDDQELLSAARDALDCIKLQ